MFSYERVQTLNQLELFVYKYVASHLEECKSMTIRDLSAQSHVSSTTILRFLKKMGFEGFSEFKYALRYHERDAQAAEKQDFGPVGQFLKQANSDEYSQKIDEVSQLIVSSDACLFFGLGSSYSMAQYGARLLANYGLFTMALSNSDRPLPITQRDYQNTLIIFLSVSGETEQVIEQAEFYHQTGAQIVAITGNVNSTLNEMADYSLTYDIPEKKIGTLNFTSQIPIVYLLEQLGERTSALIYQPENDKEFQMK